MRVSRGKSCLLHLPCKNYRRTSQKPPPSNGRSFANFTDFFSLNRLDTDSQELSQQSVFVFLAQSSIQLSNTSVTAVTPRPGTLPDSQHLQVTSRLLLGRCFNDESHKKNRNRNGSAEVSNVRV